MAMVRKKKSYNLEVMWSIWSELFQIVSLQDGLVSTEFHDVKKQKHGFKSINSLMILKTNLINQKKS